MNNLENILERQHLLNDRLFDCTRDQTATVDKIVGCNVETGIGTAESPAPNGLIQQLIEAQERTNSLISAFSDNNRRLIEGVYLKVEAPYASGIGTVQETSL